MTDDVLKELRRQQERINEILEPSRRLQDEIRRSIAPVWELEEALGRATERFRAMGAPDDLLHSMARIGPSDLADFRTITALTASNREFAEISEAIRRQSQWIGETYKLPIEIEKLTAAEATSLSALEKLAASQSALLDPQRWQEPIPFSSAITDIFHMGRSAWALAIPSVLPSSGLLEKLTRASEEMTARFAAISDSALVSIRPEDAQRQAAAVALALAGC